MCGICGYIHLDSSRRPSEFVLKAMADAIAHRGPDDQGIHVDGNLGFAHRRLSIIDLATGHQPMLNEDESIAIVYNGEIYNFRELREDLIGKGRRFRTNSDTEVIIHAYEEYGDACLDRFNGMFALALWDRRKNSLFLATDRFGKKPLYYASFDNQFIFASELKALLKHPSVRKEIDMGALSKYLAYDYVPAPQSIFRNISKLEPASVLTLSGGSISMRNYWDLKLSRVGTADVEDIKARLTDLLRQSVGRRLISDVPLGVFLSGGIDSSAVVAMMAELMPSDKIKTFSISFREGEFDESEDARRVAKHFGTDHHEETLSPSSMLDIFPRIIDTLDEPFADSSIIPTYLVSAFTRKTVKVALGGDGGDELFLGYPSFAAYRLEDCLSWVPDSIKAAALGLAVRLMPYSRGHMNAYSYARRFARGLGFPRNVRQQIFIGSFTPRDERRLFLSDKKIDYDILSIYKTTDTAFRRAEGLGALERAMYVYIKTYMAGDILAKVDRASMANSLEVRAPFLDKDFVEFASGVPAGLKLKGLASKWILRQALKARLPIETINKKKRGFAVPVDRWLAGSLKPMLLSAMNSPKIKQEGLFNPAYVEKLARDFLSSGRDVRREIWSLFMFEMWYDKWMR